MLTCDPGIDDAVALAIAAGRADCEVRAIVAGAGNVDALTAWRNAMGLAGLFGIDAPVGIGSAAAASGAPIQREGGTHGADGLAGLSGRLPIRPAGPADGPQVDGPRPLDGVSLMRGRVLATGPLTDVALALRAGRPIGRVVWMGGSLAGSGSADPSPIAEFNASADPQAVAEVLASPIDVVIVPLDVTRQVTLASGDVERWAGGPACARFCAALTESRLSGGVVVLHDPVAVVAALEPDLFGWERLRVRCSLGDDHQRGALVAERSPEPSTNARVAVAVDAPAVRDRIVEAVLGAGG